MRVLLLAALALAGCVGTPPEAEAPASPPPPEPESEPAPAEVPEAPAPREPEARVEPGEARAEGKATLIAHPLVLPTDRLGLRFTLPDGYARANVTLAWNATLPTQQRLALRIHEEGVLDAQGRMDLAGGAPLVRVLSGPSPLSWDATPADLPPGTYDAHAYPADETMPVVEQPFVIRVAWT